MACPPQHVSRTLHDRANRKDRDVPSYIHRQRLGGAASGGAAILAGRRRYRGGFIENEQREDAVEDTPVGSWILALFDHPREYGPGFAEQSHRVDSSKFYTDVDLADIFFQTVVFKEHCYYH
jgi:hypothetical protein